MSKDEAVQDIFTLPEGTAMLQYPATLSAESYQDLSDWLNLMKRKIGRSVATKDSRFDALEAETK